MDRNSIYQRLIERDPDANVEVIDLTGTQDHWEVHVESDIFQGLSRIQQHKRVMDYFQQELASGEIHALSIRTRVKNNV